MPSYNPYYANNNFYMQSLQQQREALDNQIRQMQQNQQQAPIPQIHQNFQLAPSNNNSEIQCKYVSDIEDVKNTFVVNLGVFINKDINTLWTKSVNGEIKTYELKEIINEDPKDIEIKELKKELDCMRMLITQNKQQTQQKEMPETNSKNTKNAKK